MWIRFMFFFFFFQAEDGIRDWSVTGVQTCALPICRERGSSLGSGKRKVDGDPQWPAGGLPSADRASAEKDRHQRRPEAHGGENDRRCLPHLMGKVAPCVAAGPDGGC